MTTQHIIKALRCFASLKEGYDPMKAIEDCPTTVLQEAADRLEQMVKLAKDMDMLRAHMECFTEDAERWTDLATCGRWPVPKDDKPNPYRKTGRYSTDPEKITERRAMYPHRAANRSEAVHRTYEGFGESHTNAQWAARLGLARNVLWRYLGKGMTVEEVVKMRGIEYPKNDLES